MKHIIFGCEGLLGYAMRLSLVGEDVVCLGRKSDSDYYFDLNDPLKIYDLMEKINPDVVHLCSYAAGVDSAEKNPIGSFKTNVTGISHILFAAKRVNAKIMFPSSSYVFQGALGFPYSEVDVTHPLNVYGKHKEILEENIRNLFPGNHIIYRTVGLFGFEPYEKKNFVYQVINNLKNNRQMKVPADQMMNPIFVNNLSSAVVSLWKRGFSGTIHLAGDVCLSKYEWARTIAEKSKIVGGLDLISPISTKELNQPANRPLNGCLDTTKYKRINTYTGKFLNFDLDRFLGVL